MVESFIGLTLLILINITNTLTLPTWTEWFPGKTALVTFDIQKKSNILRIGCYFSGLMLTS
jgi:hypothetical protein